ncbi:MAG: hypothetical protein IJA61_03495 [Clostridia bacterium]|nr:hypothetical protein [Clostridia bacterium]
MTEDNNITTKYGFITDGMFRENSWEVIYADQSVVAAIAVFATDIKQSANLTGSLSLNITYGNMWA